MTVLRSGHDCRPGHGAGQPGPSGTPEAPEELSLAAEFDTPDRERWRELVAEALSKSGREVDAASAEAAIATATDDGFDIAAYTAEDAPGVPTGAPGLPPFTRASRPEGHVAEGWYRRQRRAFGADVDPKDAHEIVMADLENGVSSLWLVLGDAGGPPVDTLPTLLDGVYLDLAPVALSAGRDTPDAAATLLRLASEHGVTTALGGSLGYDPLLARTHGGAVLTGEFTDAMVEHSRAAADRHPNLATVVADGLPYHEAGGSDGQELGAALAAGLHAVRVLNDAGLSVDDAFARARVPLAATADQFATIAELRAARRLLGPDRLVAGASAGARALRQHAVTSPVMMTSRDPWVNMLRTTVACVGGRRRWGGRGHRAAVRRRARPARRLRPPDRPQHPGAAGGGVPPGPRDRPGRRVLVRRVAHRRARPRRLGGVHRDRAAPAGSAAALDSGSLAATLAATWDRAVEPARPPPGPDHRRQRVPEPAEKLPEPQPAAPARPRPAGCPASAHAQAFEALRDRADAADQRPRVVPRHARPVARHTARATFAANLFQAGGMR